MDPVHAILRFALTRRLREANIDAAFERYAGESEVPMDYPTFAEAVSGAVRDGLIREPVRLPEGSLQCHWQLELTAQGVEMARESKRDAPRLKPESTGGKWWR